MYILCIYTQVFFQPQCGGGGGRYETVQKLVAERDPA